MPGNIRRAEHFLHVLRRLIQYLEGRLETENVEKEGPVGFVASISTHAGIDQKTLKFCYDRLHSLMLTLEITDTDEFLHIQTICDFATLVGTYSRGFSIIIEPFDERMPHIPDPVLQVFCVFILFLKFYICCQFVRFLFDGYCMHGFFVIASPKKDFACHSKHVEIKIFNLNFELQLESS